MLDNGETISNNVTGATPAAGLFVMPKKKPRKARAKAPKQDLAPSQPPRDQKDRPTALRKEKRDAAGDVPGEFGMWHALDWNASGGKEAKSYPYVVARAKRADEDGQPTQTVCLAGPKGRLLRFASKSSAADVAHSQNQIRLDF